MRWFLRGRSFDLRNEWVKLSPIICEGAPYVDFYSMSRNERTFQLGVFQISFGCGWGQLNSNILLESALRPHFRGDNLNLWTPAKGFAF